jgi:hypothetical protein
MKGEPPFLELGDQHVFTRGEVPALSSNFPLRNWSDVGEEILVARAADWRRKLLLPPIIEALVLVRHKSCDLLILLIRFVFSVCIRISRSICAHLSTGL